MKDDEIRDLVLEENAQYHIYSRVRLNTVCNDCDITSNTDGNH